MVKEEEGGTEEEERVDGGGGYNCTIFLGACQLFSGFTNLVDRTEFGHCSNSGFSMENFRIILREIRKKKADRY